MTGIPTQLITEHLSRDPALLREARRRLTVQDRPAGLRDQIEFALRRGQRANYVAIHNARMIRTHPQLGALRRALVQWAAQHAPADVGGFPALLAWALAQVEWAEVVHCVTMAAQHRACRPIIARPVGALRHS